VVARCSPDEYRVARGEAVTGNGFLRTGEDEADDAVEMDKDRIDNDGTRGLLFRSAVSSWSLLIR